MGWTDNVVKGVLVQKILFFNLVIFKSVQLGFAILQQMLHLASLFLIKCTTSFSLLFGCQGTVNRAEENRNTCREQLSTRFILRFTFPQL